MSTSARAPVTAASASARAAPSGRRRLDDCSSTQVFIVGVARTPLGSFQGSLSHLTAPELGAIAIRAAVERSGVPPEAVDEVLLGNVCSANLGQAPARQAALKAGLPLGTDCTTVNKVCASGMKAISLGAQSIIAGSNSVVVAGGFESMSNIPYYIPSMREGTRMGHTELVDGMLRDGLWDPHHDIHMGECAELCAERYGFTREMQDAHAVESVARARQAMEAGLVDWEVVPVKVPGPRGSAPRMFKEDEPVSKANAEKLRRLRPFFRQESGTVTAGNASPITDGAAAVVLASGEAVKRLGLTPLARIRGFHDAAQDPREFTTAPTLAIPRALEHAGIAKSEVDYWEVNEAFSVVDLVNQKLLGLASDRVNAFGGAVAIGHPIGASGARLIVTLLNVLRCKDARFGTAAICNGGGGASALVIERLPGCK